MAGTRPRLIVEKGADGAIESLRQRLGERYDIVVRHDDSKSPSRSQPDAAGQPEPETERHPDAPSIDARMASMLFEAIGEGVCLVSLAGEPIWHNQWFNNLPEPVRAEVLRVSREAGAEFAHRAAVEESPATRRYEIGDADGGRSFDVELSPVPAPDDRGALRLAAIVRDVTARSRHARRLDAIDRAGAEMAHFDPEQIRNGSTINRLEILEEKIIRFAHELLDADHFSIRLLDKQTARLESVFSHGMPEGIREVRLLPGSEGNGICGHVAATGRSYLCTNPSEDPLYLPGLESAQTTLTVPLRLHDEVIGVMDIESCEPNAFTDEDRQVAEIFAGHIALAMHILDLLLIQRSTTNQAACGRVEGELNEPLQDILVEAESMLNEREGADPQTERHLKRIKSDVESIRRRMQEVAAGPQSLLGVERALSDSPEDPLLTGLRVLVADDEAKIRRVLGDVLRHRGAHVTICDDGRGAIEALERIKAGQESAFDLIISDIKMPDRNGYEVFSAAQDAVPGVPVILMTGFGYDPHHSIVRASQEGLQSVLFKPFQVERLIEELHKAVRREPANH